MQVNTQLGPTVAERTPLRQAAAMVGRFLQRTGVYVPLLFLALTIWRAPYADPQDWDYDEGINLMKTMLYSRGFALYKDVWNDQPPLLTAMLAGWLDLFGESVAAARVLMVIFSTLLVWVLFLAMRRTTSTFAALVATGLLLLSEFFIRLSGAVMIGLPSLALATAAAALVVGSPRRTWQVAASGVVMALALQTKFIVALALPAIGLHLLFVDPPGARRSWRERLVQTAVWAGVMAAVFLAIGVYFQAFHLDMLLGTHFGARTRQQYLFLRDSSTFLPNFFRQGAAYLMVALVGVVWAIRARDRGIVLPLVWFLTTLAALTIHRPLWYHHVTLLNVPLCWLVAFGAESWWRAFRRLGSEVQPAATQRRSAVLTVTAVALALAVALLPVPLKQRLEEQARIYRPNYIPPIFEQLRADVQAQPGWVFTDHPFYAFQVGMPVPPAMAVVSRKRIETGIITEAMMLDALRTYQPRYVLLERFVEWYSPGLMEEIDRRYDLVQQVDPARYYRLKPEFAAGALPGE